MTAKRPRRITARWQNWDGTSLEHVEIGLEADRIMIDGTYIAPPEDAYAVRYRIRCDGNWRTQNVDVEVAGRARTILSADGAGGWFDEHGRPIKALQGAIDPDLAITPLTNTIPIQRMSLAHTESADIVTAWMSFPDLAIHADPQRYTCLEPGRRWRYESRDSDFTRELEIDADGLVVTYPGLFRRVR